MSVFTCKDLISMGRHIPTPLQISVKDDNSEQIVKLEKILRIVPGKRIVALAIWKEQSVIIKLFFRSGYWKKNMLRDLHGVNLLRQASISTPRIIGQATTSDRHGALLMFEYLQNGTSLLSLFEEARSDVEKRQIMQQGVEAIAACHKKGLWQKDIHLDNFMLSGNKVYVLDGGEIKGDGGELKSSICSKNLARFFSQFPIEMDIGVQELILHYQRHSPNVSEEALGKIPSRLVEARKLRLTKYEGKLFRSTSANRRVRSFNRYAVYDRSVHTPELEEFIRNPDILMSKGKMLKNGNTSTVVMVQFGGRDFVLKRYNIKNLIHGLTRLFQPSRAHHSWRNALVLGMLGVATPQPYLVLEERILWFFRRRAWYLSEFISSENLLQQIENDGDNLQPMGVILDRFKQLFMVLNEYNISHGDMKISNFILRNEQLYVLDLDAMRRHRTAAAANQRLQKDIERFRKNFSGTPFESAAQEEFKDLYAVSVN